MPFNPSALAQAAQNPGFDEPPPDGDYEVKLYKSTIFEAGPNAKTPGAQMLRLHWRVLEGAMRDHEWASIHPLDDDAPGLGVTAQVLTTVGIDVVAIAQQTGSNITDLRKALDRVEGGTYTVRVTTKGQYRNTMPQESIEARLAENNASAPPSQQGYGEPPAKPASNAIYQGDDPPASDVTEPPKRGDIDPETGEPIPF